MSDKTLVKSALTTVVLLALVSACGLGSDAGESAADDASSAQHATEGSEGDAGGGSTGDSGPGTGGDGDTQASASSESDASESDHGSGDGKVKRDYDGLPKSGKQQSPVLSQIPGNKDASCIDTSGMRNARSGSIAAGPFDQVDQSYGTKVPGKPRHSIRIYWIPMSSNPDGLTVRVSKSDGGATSTVKKSQVSEADQWKFFDTNIPISEPGTWVLRARSGSNHGCFEVTVS